MVSNFWRIEFERLRGRFERRGLSVWRFEDLHGLGWSKTFERLNVFNDSKNLQNCNSVKHSEALKTLGHVENLISLKRLND